MLTRARHVLIDNHVDLIEGIKAIERSRRAYDRGEPGQLLLITGASGTGKSTIQREWIRREYQRIVRTTGRIPQICNYGLVVTDGIDGDERPIVFVNASSSRSTNALATQILRALGAEVPEGAPRPSDPRPIEDATRRTENPPSFHRRVPSHRLVSRRTGRGAVGTRQGSAGRDPSAAGAERHAEGRTPGGRPIRSLTAVAACGFRWNRSAGVARSIHRQEFLDFLSDLEEGMDLPEASNLSDPKRAGRIHASTGGILGRVTRLILIALEHGLEDGVMHVADRYLAYAHETLKRSGERSNPFQPQASKNEQAPRRPPCSGRRGHAAPYRANRPSPPTRKTARTV